MHPIAALYVSESGPYIRRPGFDCYTESRPAETFTGPGPVIGHPPCARWTARWHGTGAHRSEPFTLGDDGGCFAFTLDAVREHGGVIEHPAHSLAYMYHGITEPDRPMIWQPCAWPFENWYALECQQHDFGHLATKPTWLLWHSPLTDLGPPPDLAPKPNPRPARRVSDLSSPQRIRTPLPFLWELARLARASRPDLTSPDATARQPS